MKKLIIATAATMLVATPAFAESFSGPYAGVEIGLDNHKLKLDTGAAIVDGLGSNGVVGGVYAGYDYSTGSDTFVGLEGFVNFSGAKMSIDDGIDLYEAKAKESYGASVRAGYKLNDKTALYARVGYLSTRFKGVLNGVDQGSDHEGAVQYGLGFQTYASENVSVRLEYTVNDYGKFSGATGTNLKNNQARLGIGYQF